VSRAVKFVGAGLHREIWLSHEKGRVALPAPPINNQVPENER
jgi:hypothetical protein